MIEDVPGMPGDPELCADCGEVYSHDATCPAPSKLEARYREWRSSDHGTMIAASIVGKAILLRSRGWHHYGIKAIAEAIRFDRAIAAGPLAEAYKVNNSYLSRLARDAMLEVPELSGFFETRELRS